MSFGNSRARQLGVTAVFQLGTFVGHFLLDLPISSLININLLRWMPIVSRRRWELQVIYPQSLLPTARLLLCSMSLVAWSPISNDPRQNPRTEKYLALKRAFLDAETTGHLSLPLLQGMILLSIYELGHAIYPAAYMSIGTCVRLGLALELEKQRQLDLDSTSYDLEEQEERRRTWWAIFILDR
jgi:hypothetical protein